MSSKLDVIHYVLFIWSLMAFFAVNYFFVPEVLKGILFGRLRSRDEGMFYTLKDRPMVFMLMIFVYIIILMSVYLSFFALGNCLFLDQSVCGD